MTLVKRGTTRFGGEDGIVDALLVFGAADESSDGEGVDVDEQIGVSIGVFTIGVGASAHSIRWRARSICMPSLRPSSSFMISHPIHCCMTVQK